MNLSRTDTAGDPRNLSRTDATGDAGYDGGLGVGRSFGDRSPKALRSGEAVLSSRDVGNTSPSVGIESVQSSRGVGRTHVAGDRGELESELSSRGVGCTHNAGCRGKLGAASLRSTVPVFPDLRFAVATTAGV